MALINDIPFLEYLLKYLSKFKIKKVILLCGYKFEKIIDYFGDGKKLKMEILYSIEDTPLGTGGAIISSLKMIENEKFIVMNGDSYFNINLTNLIEHHYINKNKITIALKELNNCDRYGSVKLSNGLIIKYDEKKKGKSGFINAGVYVMNKEIFSNSNFGKAFSFENEIIPDLIRNRLISGKVMDGDFIDIGVPDSYNNAREFINMVLKNNF